MCFQRSAVRHAVGPLCSLIKIGRRMHAQTRTAAPGLQVLTYGWEYVKDGAIHGEKHVCTLTSVGRPWHAQQASSCHASCWTAPVSACVQTCRSSTDRQCRCSQHNRSAHQVKRLRPIQGKHYEEMGGEFAGCLAHAAGLQVSQGCRQMQG